MPEGNKSDPRPDKSTDGPKYPNAGESESHPAPGGVGTDTKNDPANEPAAQPGGRAPERSDRR